MPKPTADQDNPGYHPDAQAYEGDAPAPTMSEVLASVDETFKGQAIETQPDDRAPHVYTTATTDAAREIIGHHDRLAAMIREDEAELTFLEEQYRLQVRQLNEAHEEARGMVEARRKDRENAAKAFAAVIANLQEKGR